MRSRFLLKLLPLLCASTLFSGTASADVKSDVIAAFQKTMTAKGYEVSGNTEAQGQKTPFKMRVQGGNRFEMELPNAAGKSVILPDVACMFVGGKWMRSPVNMSQTVAQYTQAGIEQTRETMRDVKDLGSATVDGQKARVLSYAADVKVMGVSSSSESKIYIGPDGRILQVEVLGRAMGVESKSLQKYRYDDSITVERPSGC
jgi:hypothetical protein